MTITDLRAPASRYEPPAPPDLTDVAERRRLSPPAVRAMERLAEAWELTVEDVGGLLGGVPASTWHSWRANPPTDLGFDRLMRVSYLLGIFTALHALHRGELADTWVRRPNTNPLFGGRTPLAAMLAGGIPVLAEVRALLDGRRGGG
jgi:hypothetical protein